MIYIRNNSEGLIDLISYVEILNPACIINTLPDDFYKYISDGKYLVNNTGLQIKDGWIDYDKIDIPTNPILEYVMSSICPVDDTIIRKCCCIGEEHEMDDYILIKLIVLHFKLDGSRIRKYDKPMLIRLNRGNKIINPLDETQMADEYELFGNMIGTVFIPQLISLAIYYLEEIINNEIYNKKL